MGELYGKICYTEKKSIFVCSPKVAKLKLVVGISIKLLYVLCMPVDSCSELRYLSATIVTLYPVRHDRYMILKVHSYVKVVLLIPSIVL